MVIHSVHSSVRVHSVHSIPVERPGEDDSSDVKILYKCYIEMVKITIKTYKIYNIVS